MGLFDFFRRKPEIRADTNEGVLDENSISGAALLRALMDKSVMTKEKALEIPTVQACIRMISDTICKLPIKLYRIVDGDVEALENDPRVFYLNNDPGDTLNAKQMWRALIEDYYLGKGAFAYVERGGRFFKGLRYVKEEDVNISFKSYHPIFKEYKILVYDKQYSPNEFIKIHRNTRDGMTSTSIIDENPLVLNMAYEEMLLELDLAKRGGLKRGYVQPEKPVTQQGIDVLKTEFRKLYENNSNVMVLNAGMKFQEATASAAELQMNENKDSNAAEICKLFGIPASMVCGSKVGNSMTDYDMNQFIRACVAVMTDIECSLNRDFLMETEKEAGYYWAFDTNELTRGSIKERYEAYKIGLEKNFLQIDEVREKEDMEPLGIDWLQLNLNTVFYNPTTKEIYTPNTNASMNLESGQGASTANISQEGGEKDESGTTS